MSGADRDETRDDPRRKLLGSLPRNEAAHAMASDVDAVPLALLSREQQQRGQVFCGADNRALFEPARLAPARQRNRPHPEHTPPGQSSQPVGEACAGLEPLLHARPLLRRRREAVHGHHQSRLVVPDCLEHVQRGSDPVHVDGNQLLSEVDAVELAEWPAVAALCLCSQRTEQRLHDVADRRDGEAPRRAAPLQRRVELSIPGIRAGRARVPGFHRLVLAFKHVERHDAAEIARRVEGIRAVEHLRVEVGGGQIEDDVVCVGRVELDAGGHSSREEARRLEQKARRRSIP
eukprot:2513602-Rhodomonas_salina.3